MSTEARSEDLLRATLAAKAAEAPSVLTVDEIRRSAAEAGRRKRRRSAAVVLVAAAAVVVAVVPVSLLRDDDPSHPPAAPSPTPSGSRAPSASPTTAPTPALLADGMRQLPQTAAPGVSFVQDTVVHLAGGGTQRLPANSPQGEVAAYHGGWLVGDPETSGVRWYDNTGQLKRQSEGSSLLAASPDGMRIAFGMDGKILIGIASGMGEGEQSVVVSDPHEAWPVGFLSEGALVYMDGGQVKTDPAIGKPMPSAMAEARAVSADDVVAGVDDQGRGMAWSARTGATLWSGSSWVVTAFSTDGTQAAATSTSGAAVAVLDVRTGKVLAQFAFTGGRVDPTGDPVIDADGSLLVSATDGRNLDEAVLRLARDGTVSRATPVFPLDPGSDSQQIRFVIGR